MIHPLISRLSEIWGPGVAVSDPVQGDLALWPDEAVAVARAIPKRRGEFAQGRSAARAAMGLLGHPPMAIPAGSDRAPIWPKGLVGSITHTNGLCAAALSQNAAALGIDAEQAVPLSVAVQDRILNKDEHGDFEATHATAVFSAKEAAYKALYPITREVWGFDAMSIRLDSQNQSFHATLHRPAGPIPSGAQLTGVFLQDSHHILTGICINGL